MRLSGCIYSTPAAYFITICTEGRRKILSNIVGDGALDVPKIELTPIGRITEKHLLSSNKIKNVVIDEYVIMPNHIHMIVWIKQGDRTRGTSRAPSPTSNENNTTRTNESIPRIISAFKRFCHMEIGQTIFQRSYYDHIIRDGADYDAIKTYILENPATWQDDELYSEE